MAKGKSKGSAIFLFCWLLSFAAPFQAQENVPIGLNFHRWGSITVFNGLPSDSVRTILQTPDGVLWFGTDNGLARFDGRRIQTFTFGSADSNRVQVLRNSPAGQFLVGTQKGAFVFADNQFQPIAGTENRGITAIQTSGEILLGTDSGLILSVAADDAGSLKARPLNTEPIANTDGTPLFVTGLASDGDRVLVGTFGRGVMVLAGGRVTEFPASPRPLFVRSLARDAAGDLWLATDAKKGMSGIYLITDSHVTRVAAASANVLALEATDAGIWSGSERYGLFRVNGGKLADSMTFENTLGGLRSNTIYSIFADREGVVWVGTNRGVSRYDPVGPLQQMVSDSPNGNFIRTLWQSGDRRRTFAGSNRGLFSFDGLKWNLVHGFEEKVVYAIGADIDGMLVGTSGGVFDQKGKSILSGDARSIQMFAGKTYAAVFGRGVVDISSDEQKVVFPDDTATSLLTSDSKLWIGTAGHGLFSYDGRNTKTEASPDTLKTGTIWKIYEAQDHVLWLAGQHGVFLYRGGQTEQAIICEDVRDVVVNGQDVWAATTTRGLLHARRDDDLGWIVSSIGFEQGLPSEKAFSILQMEGRMLIATNRGVVSYYPRNLAPTLIAVRVLSQRMHDLADLSSKIALDYPQNSLLVEVAGQSSRTFPEEFQYSFLLKNAKGEVIDSRFSNDPQYAPTGLKPGDYTIESKAYNRDLLASEPLKIRFSVARAPFPWTATALGVLLMMSLVALVWAVVERRRIKKGNAELAAARFDLANEAERERRRIARDLHDQTLADLRTLMITSDKGTMDSTEFRTEIEAVSTEIRRICEDLSPSVLENVGLVASLEFLLTHTVENGIFTADESVEERIKFPMTVQLQIYRIAQEVLTNINKHSNAAKVEMNVTDSENNEFHLTIRDDGAVFQPQGSTGKGRGIANIRSRANLINAHVIWCQSGGGNVFTFRRGG
ncbi:MAG: two-component regulator propeller domain-containing protein [Acidobacteriota bacterium]